MKREKSAKIEDLVSEDILGLSEEKFIEFTCTNYNCDINSGKCCVLILEVTSLYYGEWAVPCAGNSIRQFIKMLRKITKNVTSIVSVKVIDTSFVEYVIICSDGAWKQMFSK